MTTQDEIIEMAIQAGINNSTNNLFFQCDKHDLNRFAQLVAAAEREACAMVADSYVGQDLEHNFSALISHNIRARGEA